MNKRRGLYFDGPPETVHVPRVRAVKPDAERALDACESVAAISAVIHQDLEAYNRFYKRVANKVGGFPGIWMIAVAAGVALTKVAEEHGPDVWDNYAYIETIDAYGTLLMSHDHEAGRLLDVDHLQVLAREAMQHNEQA